MRLSQAQAGEDGHIAHISGYVEMKVDPFDEIEKPILLLGIASQISQLNTISRPII